MPGLHQPARRLTAGLAHAQIYPGVGNLTDPAFGDYTQWQIDFCQPDSWKGYNVAFAASAFPGAEFTSGGSMTRRSPIPPTPSSPPTRTSSGGIPGFFNICIHKGLSASGTQPGGPNNMPQWGNPDDMVKVATDWPQFNFIIYHSCIRPSFWVLQSLEDIENLPGAMSPTVLTDSRGHTVPNIRWSTQFAQIAAGRYEAGAEPTSTSPSSHRRLPNVYAELGTTMASMIVTFPTVWSHLIGQLLYYMGSKNIVFGSDSMWYGGPNWQVEALWRFQIPEQLRERWDYPALTEHDKRNILGLNSARLYGLHGREAQAVGRPGSAYKQGHLSEYPSPTQPGSAIDTVLQGPGYPAPITPALIPNDNFTKAKAQYADTGGGRDNARLGWVRTTEITARPRLEPADARLSPAGRRCVLPGSSGSRAATPGAPAPDVRRRAARARLVSRSRRQSPRRRWAAPSRAPSAAGRSRSAAGPGP